MDANIALATPEPFTDEEIAAARKLRLRLADTLPEEFDSDFFIGRWMRMYKNDEKTLENKLNELIEHRRAFGYNGENILQKCQELEFAKKTFERFGISDLKMDVFSDNVAVFVQKMEGADLKEITKVIPLSYVIHSYYLLHECFQRVMRQKELETGKPAAVVVVLDLTGLPLTDFINPVSNSSKLARLIVKVWSDFFSENMIHLYLMHPPGILSLMWQVAKHIVDAKTQSQIMFVTKTEDLHKCLKLDAIPEDFGGKRRDDSGYTDRPETCVQTPFFVKPEHYFDRAVWWKSQGFHKTPETKSVSIKSKALHEIPLEAKEGERILWEFTTSSDVTFEIVRLIKKSGSPASLKENVPAVGTRRDSIDEETIMPKITVTSLKVPEHGVVTALHAGEYRIRFGYPTGGWLSAKVHVFATVAPKL
uniref:CRAL-TRIO domain-containing protein n=1 Tax=Panagrellus redivivus TaxID=6233 RepID=A0A7E4UP29_PANRE